MNINEQDFCIKPRRIGGETCYLVHLKSIAIKWTVDTLKYRSSIWTKDDKLISAGFPKFFNWGEKDDIIPPPQSLKNTTIVEKIDGSLLILSLYNGELIARTRGTSSVEGFANGTPELAILFKQYPQIRSILSDQYSLLFEWYSPNNKIVIDMGNEPDWFLVGKIYHANYMLCPQNLLDILAEKYELKRPQLYHFTSMDELLSVVKEFKGKEGICLYYNGDQNIKKIKSIWYLKLHALKNELNIETTLDVYLDNPTDSYLKFESKFEELTDFEILQVARPYISRIFEAKKEVTKIIEHMQIFTAPLKELTRKESAKQILSAYGKTNRSGMVFDILDGKQLTKDQMKKLYFQILKK